MKKKYAAVIERSDTGEMYRVDVTADNSDEAARAVIPAIIGIGRKDGLCELYYDAFDRAFAMHGKRRRKVYFYIYLRRSERKAK